MKKTMKRHILLLLLPLALVACSGGLEVENVWGRASPTGADNGAFYMQVANNGREHDALVAVRSPACRAVELHQSRVDEEGVMRMGAVAEIELPAGETVELQPGGLHAMCIDLAEPLTPGRSVPLTLVFAGAGERAVEAEIRERAP